MSAFYLVLLVVGSKTLYSKISQLVSSIKQRDRERISVDLFFLFLSLALIIGLIFLKEYLF
jgi:hypothetical protein